MENTSVKDCIHCENCFLAGKKLDCRKSYLDVDFASDKGCQDFEPWKDEPPKLVIKCLDEEMAAYNKELADTRTIVIAWCNGYFSEFKAGDVAVGTKCLGLIYLNPSTIYIPLKDIRWFSFEKLVSGYDDDEDEWVKTDEYFARIPQWSPTLSPRFRHVFSDEPMDTEDKELMSPGKVVVRWKDNKENEFEAVEVRVGDQYLAMISPDLDTIVVPLSGIRWFRSEKLAICSVNKDYKQEFEALRSHK